MAQRLWDKIRTEKKQRERAKMRVFSLPKERWKLIIGFNDYMVSNFARVKRMARNQPNVHGTISVRGEKLIIYSKNKKYPHVCLFDNFGNKKYKLVHRLVAKAFIPNPYNKPEVNHKRGRLNGHHSSNLEWVTKSENERHAHNIGLKIAAFGETHPHAKLTKKQIDEIKSKYKYLVYTSPMLAKEYGVSQSHIILIVNGKHRKNG